MILGQGSYAIVVGPLSFRQVRLLFRGTKISDDGAAYVVKAFNKPPVGADQLGFIARKQALYDRLRGQLRHHSVILPLDTRILRAQDVVRVLPVLAGRFTDPRQEVRVELQHYGGVGMEKVVYGKHVMSLRRFVLLWRSVSDILEDCFHILVDNDLIITDVKMENMVLSPDDGRLRLIDADVNPNTKNAPRISTPYIADMPAQYLSDQWWFNVANRDLVAAKYKEGHEHVLGREEDKDLVSVLRFIHRNRHPFLFARRGRLSPDENKFQRVYFVIYPIFLTIVLLVAYGRVRARTPAGKDYLRRVVAFCLGVLRDRGRFADRFSYRTFQRFLWRMRSV